MKRQVWLLFFCAALMQASTVGQVVMAALIGHSLAGDKSLSTLPIAIQMAVTGGLAPNQKPMIAKLGIKALVAGTLSNLMSAALAGILLPG